MTSVDGSRCSCYNIINVGNTVKDQTHFRPRRGAKMHSLYCMHIMYQLLYD
jgi:hypothetical protein